LVTLVPARPLSFINSTIIKIITLLSAEFRRRPWGLHWSGQFSMGYWRLQRRSLTPGVGVLQLRIGCRDIEAIQASLQAPYRSGVELFFRSKVTSGRASSGRFTSSAMFRLNGKACIDVAKNVPEMKSIMRRLCCPTQVLLLGSR
jgi:hypothetical protein